MRVVVEMSVDVVNGDEEDTSEVTAETTVAVIEALINRYDETIRLEDKGYIILGGTLILHG